MVVEEKSFLAAGDGIAAGYDNLGWASSSSARATTSATAGQSGNMIQPQFWLPPATVMEVRDHVIKVHC